MAAGVWSLGVAPRRRVEVCDRRRHVGALPRESVCERDRRVRRARGVGTAGARHY